MLDEALKREKQYCANICSPKTDDGKDYFINDKKTIIMHNMQIKHIMHEFITITKYI
jgi:hypothetical protein